MYSFRMYDLNWC